MSAFRLALKPLKLSQRLYGTATPARMASVTEAKNVAPKAVSAAALHASGPLRNDWKRDEIQAIFDSPLMDLMFYGVSISIKDDCICLEIELRRLSRHQ
jgi:biotin synthase